jgi:hypothetical protein
MDPLVHRRKWWSTANVSSTLVSESLWTVTSDMASGLATGIAGLDPWVHGTAIWTWAVTGNVAISLATGVTFCASGKAITGVMVALAAAVADNGPWTSKTTTSSEASEASARNWSSTAHSWGVGAVTGEMAWLRAVVAAARIAGETEGWAVSRDVAHSRAAVALL